MKVRMAKVLKFYYQLFLQINNSQLLKGTKIMIKHLLLLSALLLSFQNAFSQGFTLADGGMVSVGRSSVAWADYDNDGDLDALVTGDHGSGPYIASVYRNDAGEFTNINAGLTGIYNSSVAWGDYDADGDQDILATGRNSSNSKTYLYTNTNGSFFQSTSGLPDIGSDGAVAWGDYDGDNDLDALIAGAYSCRIYQNESGIFTDINAGLPMVSNCWVDWGDFDNDGDLDVFVMGDLGGILIASVYKNTEGNFTVCPQANIAPLAGGSSSWSDFDHDRDLDLLISGFNEFLEPYTSVYSNLGNMEFMDVNPGLTGASLGTTAWGDYNNDGEPDILLTGQNAGCGTLSSLVYRNDGNTIFTDIDAPLDGAERGSAAWGDYDNDGDQDLLISGITGAGTPATRLYSNDLGSNVFSANLAPGIPGNLSTYIDGHTVYLGWDGSTDDHTPAPGLTYNLRIYNENGTEVMAAMAHPETGRRLVPQPGNTGNNTDWIVNLPDGTYTWQVQAIDHSFAASQFSYINTFTILNVGMTDERNTGVRIFPNPTAESITVVANKPIEFEVITLDGRQILQSQKTNGNTIINTSDWKSGIYILKYASHNTTSYHKIVRQ